MGIRNVVHLMMEKSFTDTACLPCPLKRMMSFCKILHGLKVHKSIHLIFPDVSIYNIVN